VGTLAALAVIGAVVAFVRGAYPPLRAAVMEHFDPDAQWKLRTVNSAGRSGAFFLPDGYASGPLPMMVVLHGDGMTPVSLVARWRQRADMDHFIVIAPDSASPSADVAGWQVPELAGRSTEDLEHIGRCIEEVLAMKGVQADPRVLVVGVGSAASMALYLASIDPRYTAFALMHGSASVDVLGDRRVHGWLSDKPGGEVTAHGSVRETRTDLQGLGFPAQYREFFADDGAGREEMASLATWWLSEPPPQGAP
jgi:poly(3-hydroxybutyrate) depolymerase